MGFQRPKKGIDFKKRDNRQLLIINAESLNKYLEALEPNEGGYHVFEVIPSGNGKSSHWVNHLRPSHNDNFTNRQTKIEAPKYRKAG